MRIKVEDAARIMGTSKLTIQQMMNQELIHIGDVYRNKKRNTYIIHSGVFSKHLGISEEQLINQINFKEE